MGGFKLEERKHLRLLSHLRENSREKLTTISKKTSIPISTLFDLLKELQESVIVKHTTIVDFSKLGYHTRAQVFLKVGREVKEKVKRHLNYHSNVNTIYKIHNNWDFIVETVHKNIKELDSFLEELDGKFEIKNKEIHYLVDEVKREGFLVK